MPYNEDLLKKVRKTMAQYPEVEEKEKMGGLSFMLNGKMCVRVQDNDLMEPGLKVILIFGWGSRSILIL